MYDKGKVITGLVIFVLIVTFPVWYNVRGAQHIPNPKILTKVKHCVKPLDYMRADHMKLLIDWRYEVVREGDRAKVTVDGVQYERSLVNGCMKCHVSEKKFCDQCHEYVDVNPYCWDCHIKPKETE
ncbi:MAG TPA: cytochrome C [Desulfobacterales bacterium]|nr:cytochrome C [Desulfobacterales bacterium]